MCSCQLGPFAIQMADFKPQNILLATGNDEMKQFVSEHRSYTFISCCEYILVQMFNHVVGYPPQVGGSFYTGELVHTSHYLRNLPVK